MNKKSVEIFRNSGEILRCKYNINIEGSKYDFSMFKKGRDCITHAERSGHVYRELIFKDKTVNKERCLTELNGIYASQKASTRCRKYTIVLFSCQGILSQVIKEF